MANPARRPISQRPATNLPQYDEETIYPHGSRIHAFFTNPERDDASPALVGEMIRYVIESDDRRLRFPVGPDAHPFMGWRSAVSDEYWVGLGGLKHDAGLLPAGVHGYGGGSALDMTAVHAQSSDRGDLSPKRAPQLTRLAVRQPCLVTSWQGRLATRTLPVSGSAAERPALGLGNRNELGSLPLAGLEARHERSGRFSG